MRYQYVHVLQILQVAKHFAISIPLHDFSHYFWSVLLQAFFFTDTLTLSSRAPRPLPTTTRVRYFCPLSAPFVQQPPSFTGMLVWTVINQKLVVG